MKVYYLVAIFSAWAYALAHPTVPSQTCWNKYQDDKQECTGISLKQWNLTDNTDTPTVTDSHHLFYCCAFIDFKKCVKNKIEKICAGVDYEYVTKDLDSIILNESGCASDLVERCKGDHVTKKKLHRDAPLYQLVPKKYPEVEEPIDPVEDPDEEPRYIPVHGTDASSMIMANSFLLVAMLIYIIFPASWLNF